MRGTVPAPDRRKDVHTGDVALLLAVAVALSLALPSFLGLGATVTTDRTDRIDL